MRPSRPLNGLMAGDARKNRSRRQTCHGGCPHPGLLWVGVGACPADADASAVPGRGDGVDPNQCDPDFDVGVNRDGMARCDDRTAGGGDELEGEGGGDECASFSTGVVLLTGDRVAVPPVGPHVSNICSHSDPRQRRSPSSPSDSSRPGARFRVDRCHSAVADPMQVPDFPGEFARAEAGGAGRGRVVERLVEVVTHASIFAQLLMRWRDAKSGTATCRFVIRGAPSTLSDRACLGAIVRGDPIGVRWTGCSELRGLAGRKRADVRGLCPRTARGVCPWTGRDAARVVLRRAAAEPPRL